MARTFLLEVGIEDMPAGVITQTEKQLVENTKNFLKEANLSFNQVTGYSTPRRFAVMVEGLDEKQADENLTVRGPAQKIAQDDEGNWSKAAIGFSRGQGGTVDDLVIKDENGEPYVYIEKHVPGLETKEILKDINTVVEKIEFPKNMKWGTTNYHYVRPIHWLVALLNDEVIPFEVFDVSTGNISEGHRFLGEQVTIAHPNEYVEKLQEQFVIANRSDRKEMIVKQLEDLCAEKNWQVPTFYTDLLEEVTDLVEYPTVFYGGFEKSYLDVPEVVLETSMIDHQRYFPVREAGDDHNMLPYFISVRNGNADHLDNVARGNEKVLSARLADSKFFYVEDQKASLEDFVEKLNQVNYHDKLGTLYKKQARGTKMVEVIAKYYDLSADEKEQLVRITEMYKFDLVTQIVGEFPTLQGAIGAIYAEERGEAPEIAQAIGEQYLPLSVTGPLPESTLGQYIALIDKLDILIQFFSINLTPTGSNDPYALRRQAIGVIRLMLELHEDSIEIDQFIDDLVEASELPVNREEDLAENKVNLIEFIKNRLEQIMQSEYKVAHDVRQAALGSTHKNISWILEVAQVLEREKNEETFKEVVESITRVINMTKKVEAADAVNEELLETDSEKALVDQMKNLEAKFGEIAEASARYQALEQISPAITAFFENNMIMVDDEAVKENRLTVLHKLATLAKQFADFSQLII